MKRTAKVESDFFQGSFDELFLERNEETDTEHQDACPDERKSYDRFLVTVAYQVLVLLYLFLVEFSTRSSGTVQFVLNVFGVIVIQLAEVGEQGADDYGGDGNAHHGVP
jgi:hypothetical protein